VPQNFGKLLSVPWLKKGCRALGCTLDNCRLTQGRNEVRWCPGQKASLAPPYSNLRSSGTKYTVLKKVLVTLLGLLGTLTVIRRPPQWFRASIAIGRPGNCAPLVPPSLRPWVHVSLFDRNINPALKLLSCSYCDFSLPRVKLAVFFQVDSLNWWLYCLWFCLILFLIYFMHFEELMMPSQ